MKTLLGLLIWMCVGVGAVSAVTAYFVPTTLDAEAYKSADAEKAGPGGFVVITDPAGPMVDRDGTRGRQFPVKTELNAETLALMAAVQADGSPLVRRVHVGEFSWARWSHKWWFTGSVAVLALCGLGQRALSGGGVVKKGAADPKDSIARAIAEVNALRDAVVAEADDDARLRLIVERVGDLQQTHLAAFAEAREVLIARHGMGRFAGIMDAFAGGERKINRAWSAAADGALGESIENLEACAPLFEETQRRMG